MPVVKEPHLSISITGHVLGTSHDFATAARFFCPPLWVYELEPHSYGLGKRESWWTGCRQEGGACKRTRMKSASRRTWTRSNVFIPSIALRYAGTRRQTTRHPESSIRCRCRSTNCGRSLKCNRPSKLAARQTPPNRYDSSDRTATSRQMDLQSLAEARHFDDLIDLAEYRFFVTSRSMDL